MMYMYYVLFFVLLCTMYYDVLCTMYYYVLRCTMYYDVLLLPNCLETIVVGKYLVRSCVVMLTVVVVAETMLGFFSQVVSDDGGKSAQCVTSSSIYTEMLRSINY